MTEPRYEGVPLRLGGREWIVPALNLRQLKRLAPKFALLAPADSRGPALTQAGVGAGITEDQIEALVEIAHAALSRNYPALTREEVSELVDLSNAGPLIRAIVGASGLRPAGAQGGGASSSKGAVGEAQAPDRSPGQAGASAPLGANASTASTGTA